MQKGVQSLPLFSVVRLEAQHAPSTNKTHRHCTVHSFVESSHTASDVIAAPLPRLENSTKGATQSRLQVVPTALEQPDTPGPSLLSANLGHPGMQYSDSPCVKPCAQLHVTVPSASSRHDVYDKPFRTLSFVRGRP